MSKVTTKVCKQCGEEKALTQFHRNPQGKYGVRSTCKACRAGESRRKPPQLFVDEDYLDAAKALVGEDNVLLPFVAESLAMADQSSNRLQRRRAEHTLRQVLHDPHGIYSDAAAEGLYEVWDRQMRQDAELASDLDERYPTITQHSREEWEIRMEPLDSFLEYEDSFDCDEYE